MKKGRFVLVLTLAAGEAGAITPAKAAPQPRIGIDTSFGDRADEAAAAFQTKHWAEAITKLDVALAMHPDNKNAAILLAMKGNALFNLDANEEALRTYDEAIRRDPQVRWVYARRGWLNYYYRNYTAAEAETGDFGRAIESGGARFSIASKSGDRERFAGTPRPFSERPAGAREDDL